MNFIRPGAPVAVHSVTTDSAAPLRSRMRAIPSQNPAPEEGLAGMSKDHDCLGNRYVILFGIAGSIFSGVIANIGLGSTAGSSITRMHGGCITGHVGARMVSCGLILLGRRRSWRFKLLLIFVLFTIRVEFLSRVWRSRIARRFKAATRCLIVQVDLPVDRQSRVK